MTSEIDDLEAWRHVRWGQLNDGQLYNLTPTDLDEAISYARLGSYEAPILAKVRALTWGVAARSKKGRDDPWPEPSPCRLDLAELVEQSGLTRQRLYEGRTSLIEGRILTEFADDSLLINLRLADWIFPKTGRPRFTAKLLAMFAKNWPRKQAKLPLDVGEDGQVPHATACGAERASVRPVHATACGAERASVRPVHATACGAERASVRPPIEERPRGFRFSEGLEIGGKRADPPTNSLAEEEGRREAPATDPPGDRATSAEPDAPRYPDAEPPLTPGQEQLLEALGAYDRDLLGQLPPDERRRLLAPHRDGYQPRLLSPTITRARGHKLPASPPPPVASNDIATEPDPETLRAWREFEERKRSWHPPRPRGASLPAAQSPQEPQAWPGEEDARRWRDSTAGVPDPGDEAFLRDFAEMRAMLAGGRRASLTKGRSA